MTMLSHANAFHIIGHIADLVVNYGISNTIVFVIEPAAEQTVKLPKIWDAMTFMWRHCNVKFQTFFNHFPTGEYWMLLVTPCLLPWKWEFILTQNQNTTLHWFSGKLWYLQHNCIGDNIVYHSASHLAFSYAYCG